MESVPTAGGAFVVSDLVRVINANRAYLSEIDGLIGDGDHGINMSKGFTAAGEQLQEGMGLGRAFTVLGDALMEGVGGSMGPLYGTFFSSLAEALGDAPALDAARFASMLDAGVAGLQELGNAKVGDKTLMDTLIPARDAYRAALADGQGFAACLDRMAAAAEKGKESTRDLVARIGRASRLGERSRGVLDAGATSCFLILESLARTLLRAMGSS